MRAARRHIGLIALLVAATVPRVWIAVIGMRHPKARFAEDSGAYVLLARHLGWYFDRSLETSRYALVRPPGYPLYLRAASGLHGFHPVAVLAGQVALSLATAGLVYAALWRLTGSRAGAVIGASVVAFDPAASTLTGYLLTETLFASLLAAFVWCVAAARTASGRSSPLRWAAAGGCLAAAAYVRPAAVYLPVILGPFVWLLAGGRRSGLVPVAFFLAAACVPAALWFANNWRLTGVPVFSTIEGQNTLFIKGAASIFLQEGTPYTDAQYSLGRQLNRRLGGGLEEHDAPAGLVVTTADLERVRLNLAELSQRERSMGLRVLVGRPRGVAKSLELGVRGMLSPTPALARPFVGARVADGPYRTVERVTTTLGALLAVCGVAGLAVSRRWPELGFLLATAAFLVLVHADLVADARYRTALWPACAVLAGCAVLVFSRLRALRR